MRSVRAIEHADICILIIDAHWFEGQDQSIFWLAERIGKVVILVNKWDLVEKKRCQLEIMKKKSEKN
jgi:GTP-binding protein